MNHYEEHKKYWDKVAKTKTFQTPFDLELFSSHVTQDARILDLGCGYGRVLGELSENGYQNIAGVDFSREMIERGKKLYPDVNLQVQKGKEIPFVDDHFDAVIILAVLTSVISDNEQVAFIEEVERVLKPGGVVYINDYLINEDDQSQARYEKTREKYGVYGVFDLPEGATFRHHNLDWIKKLLSHFKEISFQEQSFTTMNGNERKGFTYLGRLSSDHP
ncbi:MAG: methyltransferase domain-containing protein [Patescibacteria group bacterium]|nr:methyltransferase domain-containing protein [Patescibacteria group bacterium]